MKRTVVVILTLCLILGSIVGCTPSEPTENNGDSKEGSESKEVYELKLGSKMPETNPESKAVAKLIELVGERSEGRLKIVPYYGESLGNLNTQLENVMMGTQDMYIESYSHYVKWVPDFAVHSIPYLFNGPDEYREFLLSDIEKEMEQQLLDKTGMKILNTEKNWIRGPYRVIVSKEPILAPKDLDGVKLRMADSKLLSEVWNQLGANVINLAWSEVYLALQQGVVESVTSPVSLLYANKFTEVCKHVTRTDEYNQQLAIVINNKKFESLPEDLKNILVDTINEVGEYESQLIEEATQRDLDKMKEEHNMEFHEPDITPWLEKMKVIFKDLEEKELIPGETVQRILKWQESK